MPSNYTPNYNLNQWEADDRVLRTDFNADNAKIDAALAALADSKANTSALEALNSRVEQVALSVPRITFGTYTGDGKPSQDIVLGFQPKALLVFREDGCVSYLFSFYYLVGGLAYPGQPVTKNNRTGLEITENGFRVYCDYNNEVLCNAEENFRYIAFH